MSCEAGVRAGGATLALFYFHEVNGQTIPPVFVQLGRNKSFFACLSLKQGQGVNHANEGWKAREAVNPR